MRGPARCVTHIRHSLISTEDNHHQIATAASPADIDDRSVRTHLISSSNSISPLHLSPAISSASPPCSPWRLRRNHDTDADIGTGALEDYSRSPREVIEGVRQRGFLLLINTNALV